MPSPGPSAAAAAYSPRAGGPPAPRLGLLRKGRRQGLGCLCSALLLSLLSLLWPPGAAFAAALPPAVFDGSSTRVQVAGRHLALLRDAAGTLTLADVTAPAVAEGFRPARTRTPSTGITRAVTWARFRIRNATDAPQALVLELRDARAAFVDVWVLGGDGGAPVHTAGGRYAGATGAAGAADAHRFLLADLPLAAGETATVLLRVRGYTSVVLDLRIAGRDSIAAKAAAEAFGLALFFGAMGIMAVYNGLLYLLLREVSYLLLALIIAGVVLWRLDFDGLLVLAWPGLRGLDISPALIGAAVAIALTPLFALAYFGPAQLPRTLLRLIGAAAALTLSVPLVHVLGHPVTATLLANLALPVVLLLAIGIALPALREQTRAAWTYLMSWLVLLLGMLEVIALNLELLPAVPAAQSSIYFTLLLWLLMLSVAQTDRMSTQRSSAERANRQLRDHEAELEQEVARRTRELAQERDSAHAASRAKTRFLAQMSHELRTPLNTVLGFAELLRRTPEVGALGRDWGNRIHRSARHLLCLIDDLLDIAAIEAGRAKLAAAAVDLHTLVLDVDHAAQRAAAAKGLGYRSEIADGLPACIATDGRRLRQLLHNLLDNAVKYTDAGEVILRAGSLPDDAPGVWLEVEDTGRGIPEAERERLFRPFEQLHPGQPGSGLGLAICQEIAKLLAGRLTLDSAPGRGSRFRFELPLAPAVPTSAPPAASDNVVGYRGARRRVLVVDDDAASRDLLGALLEQLGCVADTADGLVAALACARSRPPDLVLTDMLMPTASGYACAWTLREATGRRELPVIIASATALAAADIAELGLNGCIAKPIERARLIEVLGAALGLDWIIGTSPALAPDPAAVPAPMSAPPASDWLPAPPEAAALPPRIELDAAAELARNGDIERLQDWCEELETGAPELSAFVAEVRRRAHHEGAPALADWLQARLAEGV
jgi:signal transduction histidine kinase/CheY-like chemotaxis protein